MKRKKKDQVLLTNDQPVFLCLPANTVTPLSCEKRSHKCNRHADTKQAGLQTKVLVTDSKHLYCCVQV